MDYKKMKRSFEVDNYKRKKLIFSDMVKLENKVQILYIHKCSEAPFCGRKYKTSFCTH